MFVQRPLLTFVAALLLAGCPQAPTNLQKTRDDPCTLTWQDNSDIEVRFNLYYGGSCDDCNATTDWSKFDEVDENVTTYERGRSCCDIAQCSCVSVNASSAWGTSDGSNIIVLSTDC